MQKFIVALTSHNNNNFYSQGLILNNDTVHSSIILQDNSLMIPEIKDLPNIFMNLLYSLHHLHRLPTENPYKENDCDSRPQKLGTVFPTSKYKTELVTGLRQQSQKHVRQVYTFKDHKHQTGFFAARERRTNGTVPSRDNTLSSFFIIFCVPIRGDGL